MGCKHQKDFVANDIELYDIQGVVNAPFTINGTVENVGSSTIQNFTVNYQIDGAGTVYSSNVIAANMASFDTDFILTIKLIHYISTYIL